MTAPGAGVLEVAETMTSPRVSVVIPALNEAHNLAHVLPALGKDIFEVILVDGGSTDDTVEVFRSLVPDGRLLRQSRSGKGEALATGLRACRGDVAVTLDADGSADPAEIPKFVCALAGGADYAKGTRFGYGGSSADITRFRKLGNWALVQLVNLLYGTHFTDLCYGMNAFRVSCLPPVIPTCDGFEVEAYINCRAARAGLRIKEVGSHEAPRLHGISKLHTIRDGFRVLRTILHEWRGWQRTPAFTLGSEPEPVVRASVLGVRVASAFGTAVSDQELGTRPRPLRVGLVNNMPDPAFRDTERQFESLIARAGAGQVELVRYWLPGLPRGPRASAWIRQRYLPYEAVKDSHLDALVITGTEPVAGRIADEPHYRPMTELFEWGVANLGSMVVSCLAAHAAAHWLDGIERTLLPQKCFGLQPGQVFVGEALAGGLPELVAMPHSHWNTVPLDHLEPRGYRPVIAAGGDWTVLTREVERCSLVLIQGHPEYDRMTLLREYRRDWARHRSVPGSRPPCAPARYFTAEADGVLAQLGRADSVPQEFPMEELSALVAGEWGPSAELLYRNWLARWTRAVRTEPLAPVAAGTW